MTILRGDLEGLLLYIERITTIMIDVATNAGTIDVPSNDEYQQLYIGIATVIEKLQGLGVAIQHQNSYKSLWDWNESFSNDLPLDTSRKKHVRNLYDPIVIQIKLALSKRPVSASDEDLLEDLGRRFPERMQETTSVFQHNMTLLHDKIIQRCREPFESKQYDDAIFNAFKVIEEEIRNRISADPKDIGVELVSKAMSPKKSSPLVFSKVESEQESAHLLYRGAIGVFKNPRSHRFPETDDPLKAFEILALASLLMRMLDET